MVFPWVTAVPEVFVSISSAGCHSGEIAGKKTTLTSDETEDQVLQGLILFKVKTGLLPCSSTNFTCREKETIV